MAYVSTCAFQCSSFHVDVEFNSPTPVLRHVRGKKVRASIAMLYIAKRINSISELYPKLQNEFWLLLQPSTIGN